MACERPLGGLVAERQPRRPGLGLASGPVCSPSGSKKDFGLGLSNCPGFESPGMQPWANVQVHRTPINQTVPFPPPCWADPHHTHTHTLTHTHMCSLLLHVCMDFGGTSPAGSHARPCGGFQEGRLLGRCVWPLVLQVGSPGAAQRPAAGFLEGSGQPTAPRPPHSIQVATSCSL